MFRSLLLALALMASLPHAVRADTISIRADEWCPYNCAVDSKKPGYGVEIAKAIFEKAGHTVDYQIMGWTRSIERTRVGDFTAILGAANADAPDFVFPKESIGKSGTAFAVLKDSNFAYQNPSSLEDRHLGAIQSYSYDDEIDAYINTNKNNKERVDLSAGDDALVKNLNKLIAGRVDVVVDDASVLLYKVNDMQISDKVKFSYSPKNQFVYLAFSPKNPKAHEYADLFDKGMAELRSSGQLKEILTRYGMKDWQ